VFANGIDLINGGAASEQRRSREPFLIQRYAIDRRRHQCRSTSRKQADNEVFCGKVTEQLANPSYTVDARLIRNRVGAFGGTYPLQGQRVIILGVDCPCVNSIAQDRLSGEGHGGCRLACTDDDNSRGTVDAEGVGPNDYGPSFELQVLPNETRRINGSEGGVKNGDTVFTPPGI
jgi:hypothetical protein